MCVNSVPFFSNIVKSVVMNLAIGISILVVLTALAFCVYILTDLAFPVFFTML